MTLKSFAWFCEFFHKKKKNHICLKFTVWNRTLARVTDSNSTIKKFHLRPALFSNQGKGRELIKTMFSKIRSG